MLMLAARHLFRNLIAPYALTATLIITIFGGILTDAGGRSWSQPVADVWAWSVYLLLVVFTVAKERRELFICLIVATMGECFLGLVWGLYQYRLHNLPLFIPPGHALVYAAGNRIRHAMPIWLPCAVVASLAPFAVSGLTSGYDTQGFIWFIVFLLCLLAASDRRFLATMFLFAFLIELQGTTLGSWRYMSRDPWFGLTTMTAPPLWAGTYYCALDVIVAYLAISGVRRFVALRGSSTCRMGCDNRLGSELG